MRARTTPIPTTFHGDVLLILYEDGHPFEVQTVGVARGVRTFRSWDFTWSKHGRCAYFTENGSGGLPVTLPRIVKGRRAFWASSDVTFVDTDGHPILDLAAHGYDRLAAPEGGDPFRDAVENAVDYCAVCQDWTAFDDRGCAHIFDGAQGGLGGPGGDTPDHVPSSLDVVVRRTGCAHALRTALRRGEGIEFFVHGPMFGELTAEVRIAGRDFSEVFNTLARDRRLDPTVVREGLHWLRALDAKTTQTNAVVQARLDAIVAARDARRASRTASYVVRVGWLGTPSERLSWSEARAAAKFYRDAGRANVRIVARAPRARAGKT